MISGIPKSQFNKIIFDKKSPFLWGNRADSINQTDSDLSEMDENGWKWSETVGKV